MKINKQNSASISALVTIAEPWTVTETLNGPFADKRKEAMDKEFQSLIKNETWELCNLPQGRHPVSCKWGFKLDYNPDGTVNKFKARLVSRGFTQVEGIDYNETDAPVMYLTSLKTLLAIATQTGLLIQKMDVQTAFLNGRLQDEIYMSQPEGYIVAGQEKTLLPTQTQPIRVETVAEGREYSH